MTDAGRQSHFVGLYGTDSSAILSAEQLFAFVTVGFHLTDHHVAIDAAGPHEVLVSPALDDPAVFHQQDQVRRGAR